MPAKKETDQQLTIPGTTDLATADYGDYAGQGTDDISRDEITLPMVRILQALSPQVDADNEKYIEGCKQGYLYNNVTNEAFDPNEGELWFVLCHRDHNYCEFTPRKDGGGFHGYRMVDDPEVQALIRQHGPFKPLPLEESGHELIETYYMFGLMSRDAGVTWEQIVIPFASSAIKVYKSVCTRLRMIKLPSGKRPPQFAFVWKINTVTVKGAKGTYKTWKFEFAAGSAVASAIKPDSDLFRQAAEFSNMAREGGVIMSAPDAPADAPAEGDSDAY